jgi:hypothetical protein
MASFIWVPLEGCSSDELEGLILASDNKRGNATIRSSCSPRRRSPARHEDGRRHGEHDARVDPDVLRPFDIVPILDFLGMFWKKIPGLITSRPMAPSGGSTRTRCTRGLDSGSRDKRESNLRRVQCARGGYPRSSCPGRKSSRGITHARIQEHLSTKADEHENPVTRALLITSASRTRRCIGGEDDGFRGKRDGSHEHATSVAGIPRGSLYTVKEHPPRSREGGSRYAEVPNVHSCCAFFPPSRCHGTETLCDRVRATRHEHVDPRP